MNLGVWKWIAVLIENDQWMEISFNSMENSIPSEFQMIFITRTDSYVLKK